MDDFKPHPVKYGVRKLTKGKQTILILCPAFEAWIFENAKMANVDPSKFGFHNRKQFEKSCKRVDAKQNDNLKQFLNSLIQKKEKAPGVKLLKTWICEAAGIDTPP